MPHYVPTRGVVRTKVCQHDICVLHKKVSRSKLGHGEDDKYILDAWEESPTLLCRMYFIDVLVVSKLNWKRVNFK